MQNRDKTIDFMRGVSIVLMILIHATAFYKSDPLAFWLWDLSQFAVPVFVFCSGYIFYVKETRTTSYHYLRYVFKRTTRLLAPYYYFLLVYIPLVFVHKPETITSNFIVKNVFLIGGIDLNWMVLMFLFLSFIIYPLFFIFNKYRLLFYIYCTVALLSSVFFIFYKPVHYKPVMWLTWSSILLVSWYFAHTIKKPINVLPIGAVSFVLFVLMRFQLLKINHSVIQFDNKYPPNIYHLLYGLFGISALFLVGGYVSRKNNIAMSLAYYFSKNSYQLFFIHFWILYLVRDIIGFRLHWIVLFIVLLVGSVFIREGLHSLARARTST